MIEQSQVNVSVFIDFFSGNILGNRSEHLLLRHLTWSRTDNEWSGQVVAKTHILDSREFPKKLWKYGSRRLGLEFCGSSLWIFTQITVSQWPVWKSKENLIPIGALNKNVRISAISAEKPFSAHGGMSDDLVDFHTLTDIKSLSVSLLLIKTKAKALRSCWDWYTTLIVMLLEVIA